MPSHDYVAFASQDDEAFQIVGIPGVEITPEHMGQDGTVLDGAKVLQGTVMDDGQVAQLEDEEEDLSLELAWVSETRSCSSAS